MIRIEQRRIDLERVPNHPSLGTHARIGVYLGHLDHVTVPDTQYSALATQYWSRSAVHHHLR